MKQIMMGLLAFLGMTSACGQKNFKDVGVEDFSKLTTISNVVLLDVRTAAEYAAGHIDGAVNIDQSQPDFMEKAKAMLPAGNPIAVYCRSGRRSASAAERLANAGWSCTNLNGGIIAWEAAGKNVAANDYEVDVFATKSGKIMKFHALGHASIRMQYDGKEIMIDPVRQIGGRTIDYAAMPKADYIFLTHEHGDHFDQKALGTLSDARTQLITNKRCAEMLGYGQAMGNGEQKSVADFLSVEALPAYNTTPGREQYHPKGRDNGYVLVIDGLRIYVAGDTEDIAEMADVKDIDIAFMPCNQPYTMTTAQLVHAAKMVQPKVLFPYHYGQTKVSGVSTQLEGAGIEVRIRHYE